MKAGTVYTIGHPNHPLPAFLALLGTVRINAIADVRSVPHSRFNPQFNRQPLCSALAREGCGYFYFGRELGGRSDDPRCYEEGRIRYDRVARTARFKAGIARLAEAAATESMALMCAEKEPLDCHRALLVSQALIEQGFDVAHIHANGSVEPHADALDRLLAMFDLDQQDDLFPQPRAALVDAAVKKQTARVGHANPAFATRGPLACAF